MKTTLSWQIVKDYLFIFFGAVIQAVSLHMFLIPANLVSGGVSGISQLINAQTGWPIGLMVFIGNIPLFILGWRFLGGKRFALRTVFLVVSFSVLIDVLAPFFPARGVTDDMILNTLYGAIGMGFGAGLVYQGKGTSGGSDILSLILHNWKGISFTQSYLMVDTVVILLAGLSFGWENALYALIRLYISGIAAESVTQGSRITRTAFIITNQPQPVADKILTLMNRGVTFLHGTGAFTGQERKIIYCVISRSEVGPIKAIVQETDPNAFMVIGNAHEALGEGFYPLSE